MNCGLSVLCLRQIWGANNRLQERYGLFRSTLRDQAFSRLYDDVEKLSCTQHRNEGKSNKSGKIRGITQVFGVNRGNSGLLLSDNADTADKSVAKRLFGEAGRYFLVSLLALGVDYGLLIVFHDVVGLDLLVANAISFSCGAVVAWTGSVLWVFRHRRISRPRNEFLIFFVIGIGGLAVNEVILGLFTTYLGVPYQLSKIFAAGSSFVFNFAVRKWLLFRATIDVHQ